MRDAFLNLRLLSAIVLLTVVMIQLGQAAPRAHAASAEDVESSDIILVIKQAKDGSFSVEEEVRGNGEFLRLFLHLLGRLELENPSRGRQYLYLNRKGRDPLDPLKAGRFPEIIGKKYVQSPVSPGRGNFLLWRGVIDGKDVW